MKSRTDLYWDDRARSIVDDALVNIDDVHQRQLELEFVVAHLEPQMRILEVGCGSGSSTDRLRQHVTHVDAFDYSQPMINRALRTVGETNNSFFVDDVLAPRVAGSGYDCVVCVRVLINLANLDDQRRALEQLEARLRSKGLLLLVEGYRDGFARLNELRSEIGLPTFEPAPINFYSHVDETLPYLESKYDVVSRFDTGAMDVLTRVVLPAIIGADNVQGVTSHHEALAAVARRFPAGGLHEFARVRGWALRRKR